MNRFSSPRELLEFKKILLKGNIVPECLGPEGGKRAHFPHRWLRSASPVPGAAEKAAQVAGEPPPAPPSRASGTYTDGDGADAGRADPRSGPGALPALQAGAFVPPSRSCFRLLRATLASTWLQGPQEGREAHPHCVRPSAVGCDVLRTGHVCVKMPSHAASPSRLHCDGEGPGPAPEPVPGSAAWSRRGCPAV